MVWVICIIVLIKLGLLNNYLLLLISNIRGLFSNVLKTIICIILSRNHLKLDKNKSNLLTKILI